MAEEGFPRRGHLAKACRRQEEPGTGEELPGKPLRVHLGQRQPEGQQGGSRVTGGGNEVRGVRAGHWGLVGHKYSGFALSELESLEEGIGAEDDVLRLPCHSVTVGIHCWGCRDKDSQTLNHRNIRLTVLGARRPRSGCGIGLAMPPLTAVGRVCSRPLF